MPGNMAPLKKPPDATRLPLALNPRKSKAILAVLAERNQAVVPVGAWVEPAVPDSSDIPAYTLARVIEEELKEKLRKKQEALKRFQRQVKHRVNQQIRLRKKQQLLKSREAAEKEGSMAMQSSHPACFTPKSTSIFPKHLNAVVGSPGLVPSQVLGDGLQDAENGSELFQQQAQALHQNMKLAHQRLASFKTVPIKKTSVFPDGKRKNILTQEELDHEEVSSVKTNEEGREDLFQVDQQEFVSEDKDVSCSRVQKVKFKNVMMEQEEQIELHPQSFHHIPQDQDHQETKGGLPESQSDLKEVHSVDLEAQDGEPLTQAVDLGIQAVELKKQTIPLEGQIVQTDTQSNMLEAQSVGLEDVSIELQTQNFLPSNQTFLAKDQSILPVHHDQNFLFEDQDILPNCQNQDFPSRGLCVFPKNQNILLKCQNQDFLPKDQSVFSKDQAILPSCADQEFLPGDPCVLLKDQNILLDCQEQNFLPKDDHVPFRKQKLPPKWQVQDFLPKDQNFLSGDQHFLPTNQNIPSKYLDQNFLPKDWSILPKDYQVLPSHQNFLSGDHRVIHNTQNIPSKYQKVHCKETNPDVADEKGREDFSLKDYQCQPPKLQFQDLLRDPSLSFRVQVSVETAERWRDDLLLNSHQHPPRRPQRDASHRKKVCNNCQSRWESRAPLAFRPGVDQEEDKKERQRQYLRHRRLFMDIEREQVKEQKRQKEQKKKIEKIKKKREQERYAEEQRLLKMDLHREPCPEEKVTETLGQLQLGEKKEAREKQLQREKEDLRYRGFILLLTFLIYTCYHMSRKPISIVKSRLHQNCSALEPINYTVNASDDSWCSWAPFDQDNYSELLGAVDNAFLVAYAIGMFISGIFGERLPLRYYLSAGMLLSGLFTSLFGLGYFWNIHMLWYFVVIQICNGLVQTTGWPSVVTCVGNWFGKGKRGLIMGVWNSHTSVGNILGSLIAGIWVNNHWGLSFVVPGIITAAVGVLTFLFLIEYPEDVDCSPPQHHGGPDEDQDNPEDPANGPYGHRENNLETGASCSKEPCEEPAAISFLGALRIPGVIEFSLCLLFAKLVSYTFLYWLPLYIFNVAHFSAKEAGDLSTLFDVGGIIGGILAGIISDYTNGRATTCCIMLLLAAPMMFLYNYIGQNGITSSIVMLIICGALVNGPYSLITTAVSADLGTHKSLKGNAKALSTVTAIIDGTGSVGAALGPLLAGLISPTGWNNVFYMLISADVLACLLLCRLVYKEIRVWKAMLSRARGYKEI